MGAHVTMVDYSQHMLKIAERHFESAGLQDQARFILTDLRELDLEEQFDLVFCTGVTDYLPKSTLPMLGSVLQRHARNLCIVSFPKYDFMSLLRWFWIGLVKKVSLSYYGMGEIERLGEQHAFSVSDVEAYPLYYVVGLSRTTD